MKRPILAALFAALLLALAAPAGALQPLDEIVAVVGKGVVLESELDTAVARVRRRIGDYADRMPENVLRSQVLDQLILQKLQLQRAARAGLQISDAELGAAIDRMAAQNNMSSKDFLAAMRDSGIPVGKMRQALRDQLLVDKLRQREVLGRIVVTNEDVDRFLESEALRVKENLEYHIRHILVAVPNGAPTRAVSAARDRVEGLREQARSGASFRELAIAQSDGQNALEGGDLGWLQGGFLPSLFSEVVPKLDEGEVSEVFRGDSGFHLIKLVGVRSTEGDLTPKKVIVEEVKLRHILLKPNEIRNQERTQAKAEQLRKRLLAGDDFAELARENSDDSATANLGGDLGWLQPQAMPPAFAQHLGQLAPGETSAPFATDSGWHIVEVLDRRQRDLSEERLRQRARQAIGRRKMKQEGAVWIQELRDEAYVEIRMEGYTGN